MTTHPKTVLVGFVDVCLNPCFKHTNKHAWLKNMFLYLQDGDVVWCSAV